MTTPYGSPEININPAHVGLLDATLQAPSAHNAQPWQIRPLSDGNTYEVHYDQHTDLPADPTDKDAYLTMGTFVETMTLQGANHGLNVAVTPELTRKGQDLYIARVALSELVEGDLVDPLSQWIGQRHTNRMPYTKEPLSSELEQQLEGLGNTLIEPETLADVVLDATMESWGDPEYIRDLKTWFRQNPDAKDGITPAPFNISRTDILFLKLAFQRAGFRSKPMQHFASDRDVKMFTSGPRAAVVAVQEVTPAAVFNAGRQLLRSWVSINAQGYAYQPFSVVVDKEEPAARVTEASGVEGTPIAVYRIGRATRPPRGHSPRKPLRDVLIP